MTIQTDISFYTPSCYLRYPPVTLVDYLYVKDYNIKNYLSLQVQ